MNKVRIAITLRVLFLCIFLSGCYSYYPPDSMLGYIDSRSYKDMSDKKLEWSDFAGKPNYSITLPSRLYWVIQYRRSWRHSDSLSKLKGDIPSKPDVIVSYGVVTDRSWVKSKYRSAELLNHEQGHVEITRLCALEFKKTVRTFFPDYGLYWNRDVDSTFRSITHKCNEMQAMYEKATKHGENKHNQLVWDKRIQALISRIQD